MPPDQNLKLNTPIRFTAFWFWKGLLVVAQGMFRELVLCSAISYLSATSHAKDCLEMQWK